MPDSFGRPEAIRATRAVVDLDAVADNVRALRGALPPQTRLMAVVKADGYGHGAPWVAGAAVEAGASLLGVATVPEGELLRHHGLDVPIVVLGAIDPGEAAAAIAADLDLTIAEGRLLEAVQLAAREHGDTLQAGVHLKIDTGLRRYGTLPEHAVSLARQIAEDEHLAFRGICTHFASADEPDEPFTAEQRSRFDRAVAEIREAGVPVPPRHVANSAGVLTGQSGDCEIARPGIALYGVPPSDDVQLLAGMRPAIRIESRIARVVPLAAGDTVGYNRTYRAAGPALGALIPLGYADGYRRSLAGKAWVGIAGERAPLLGRVSMDQIVAQIPDSVQASPGDPVQIMGGAPEFGAPSIAEMAALMETNTYEVLVGIRGRIPRVFVRGGEIIDVRRASGDRLGSLLEQA